MSTRMTEADWEVALEASLACLPARGAKARDDRLFLEALHGFMVHDISWGALPERFGPWNSVWTPQKTDHDGRPIAFELTGGQASDAPMVATLIDAGPDEVPRAVVGDKGYDSDANRAIARECGVVPVIPYRSNRKSIPARFARALYRRG